MKILEGKYNFAKVFTDNIEETASSQIVKLLDQDFVTGAKVRIMPDTHAGAGCVIGFTADLGDKVIPNLVGVDIGCGMSIAHLGRPSFDLDYLDDIIHTFVPSGHNIHEAPIEILDEINELFCYNEIRNQSKFNRSIGSLGGGNHFIELNLDDMGNKYLVIHSGSRNLGKQVADYYQNLAVESCKGLEDINLVKEMTIAELKSRGMSNLINQELKNIDQHYKTTNPEYPKELCFLQGELKNNYLHDMEICQRYASLNRETMMNSILFNLLGSELSDYEYFQTIHNYINFEDNIIRKGAVSAKEGESLIIPINMRDGSILAVGKGNEDWNNSAPHGAGRIMGRMEAKRRLSMSEYTEQMQGIFTTTANESTLDEAPMAYKPMQEILDNIQDTVEVVDIIKPIYNYKSAE